MPRTLAALVLATISGCALPEPPGELVGAYRIEGTLTDNECGTDALPADDALTFDVEIREQDEHGLWLMRGAPPPRPGTLDDDGEFAFEVQNIYPVAPGQQQSLELMNERQIEELSDPEALQRRAERPTPQCRL